MCQLWRKSQRCLPWLPEVQTSQKHSHSFGETGHKLQRRCCALQEDGQGKHKNNYCSACHSLVSNQRSGDSANKDDHRHTDGRNRRCGCYSHFNRIRSDERPDHVSAEYYGHSTAVVSKTDSSRNSRTGTSHPAALHCPERDQATQQQNGRPTDDRRSMTTQWLMLITQQMLFLSSTSHNTARCVNMTASRRCEKTIHHHVS